MLDAVSGVKLELINLDPVNMSTELRGIRPLIHSGLDDLESFLAWSEQIKLEMSVTNPLLYRVLGNLAFSRHAIAGGDSLGQASFLEQKSHQNSGEDRAKEARELQISNEGRQLGRLLVQRTKGDTQLQVTKWLSATNGWGSREATQLELPLQTSSKPVANKPWWWATSLAYHCFLSFVCKELCFHIVSVCFFFFAKKYFLRVVL